MNISETSSCGRRDPITSIRAHISQKKREFDTLSNTDDGQLLQEAFARAASGSRSGERRVKKNHNDLSRTTDIQKSFANALQNNYLNRKTVAEDYDLKNPVILSSSNTYQYKLNPQNQYVQIDKVMGKREDSLGENSLKEDNYSLETKSQFTDHAFEINQKFTQSRSSQQRMEFATENLDGKIAQHILKKQVTQMTDEEYQYANFQQNLSQLDQNSKEDKVSYEVPKIHIYEEKIKPMDLDELNESRLSPQRSRTSYGNEQQAKHTVNRTKYQMFNDEAYQQSLCEDSNYLISVNKITGESQLSTDQMNALDAHVSVQSNQVLNIKTSKSSDLYSHQRLKAPIKQISENKRLEYVRQLHCPSQQKTAKSPKSYQSTTLNVLARKRDLNKSKLSKSQTDTKLNRSHLKVRDNAGAMINNYHLQAAKIQKDSASKQQTPIVQYQSNASVMRDKLSQSASKNCSYNSATAKPSQIQRVQSQSSQKSRVKHRFNQLQSTQSGTPTNVADKSIRDSSQPMRSGSNARGSSVASGGRKHNYMQSTYAASVSYGVKSASQKVTPEMIQKDMVSAFSKVRLDLYQDVLRIKKPQAQAFTASQMICKLVNSFRGGSQKTNSDKLFEDWQSIQDFIHRKPNVIKFNQEITQLIQHMILSQDYLRQLQSGQLKNHLNKLIKLQAQYFGLDSHHQVLKQFMNQKNFKNIVNIVYTLVRYVLFQAGRTDLINMGNEEEGEEENTIQKSIMSVKSDNQKNQRPASANLNRSNRSPSNKKFESAEKLGHRPQLNRRPYDAGRKYGVESNSNVTPKSLHKQELHDQMSKTQQISKLPSPEKNYQSYKPSPKIDYSAGKSAGLQESCEVNSYAAYNKLPPSQTGSRPSSNRGQQRSQPKKLYEMMLEKQKKSLHNKYERLTMNSVGKRSQQAHSQQKRIDTTPGSRAHNISVGRDSSHESTNIIINQRGFDLKTPSKQVPLDQVEEGTPMQASPLACHIKFTPLAGRYGIVQSPSPQKPLSPVKSSLNQDSKNSRARKSRQERINAAKGEQCSFNNAIISAHQEIDAIHSSLSELYNDPQMSCESGYQILKHTSIMDIPSSACQLGSCNLSEQESPDRKLERKYVPKAISYLMPLQIQSREKTTPVKAQNIERSQENLPLESRIENNLIYPVMQTEESENCVIRQIQMKAPLPYEQQPEPILSLPSIRVLVQASPEKFCETTRLPVNLESSDSQSQGSVYDNRSGDEHQERVPIESQRYSQRSPQIDLEAEAERIACFIKFEVDQDSQSLSPDKQSQSVSPDKEQTPLLAKGYCQNQLKEQSDDLGQLSQRTDQYNTKNGLESIPCPESIHTRNATLVVETNRQVYSNHQFHEDDESIKTQRDLIDQNLYFVKETIHMRSDPNLDAQEADNMTTGSKPLNGIASITQEIKCSQYKNPCDQSELSPQKGQYDSIPYDQQSSESQGESPVIVRGSNAILFEEEQEDSPQPRHQSPKRITQKNDNNQTFKKIEEKQATITSEEDYDSELCMKEIISPFREMSLNRNQRNVSPQERQQAMDSTGWKINPIQVKREDTNNDEDNTPRMQYSVQQEDQDDVYSSNGSPSSPCESPVRQHQYAAFALQMKLQQQSTTQEYQNQYVSKKEYIISPGKLKLEVSKQRAYIIDQLDAIEQEILDNSPSKNPVIDRTLINQLKQRRLNSRKAEKSIYDEQSQKKYQDSVISELKNTLVNQK